LSNRSDSSADWDPVPSVGLSSADWTVSLGRACSAERRCSSVGLLAEKGSVSQSGLLGREVESPQSGARQRKGPCPSVGLSSAEWAALSVGLARQRDAVHYVGLLAEKGCVSQSGLLGKRDEVNLRQVLGRERTLSLGRAQHSRSGLLGGEGCRQSRLCLSVGLARHGDEVTSVEAPNKGLRSWSGSARQNGWHFRSGLLGRETLSDRSGCWRRRAPSPSRACSAERCCPSVGYARRTVFDGTI
jgi:hypothetical protein